jgi:hypothetical protein
MAAEPGKGERMTEKRDPQKTGQMIDITRLISRHEIYIEPWWTRRDPISAWNVLIELLVESNDDARIQQLIITGPNGKPNSQMDWVEEGNWLTLTDETGTRRMSLVYRNTYPNTILTQISKYYREEGEWIYELPESGADD